MRRILTLAFVVLSYFNESKAQFLDSGLVLIHDLTIGYNRFKTFESQFQGSSNSAQEGTYPVFTFGYSPALGKLKNNRLTFYGLNIRFGSNKLAAPNNNPNLRYDTTAWSGGIVFGKKYFISVAKNFFIVPSGFVSLNYGKEKLKVTATIIPYPTNYSSTTYSGELVFQPLRFGYRLSGKSLFEINLLQSELSYFKKNGSRSGTTNKIERSYFVFGNRFLSNILFSFTHILKSKA